MRGKTYHNRYDTDTVKELTAYRKVENPAVIPEFYKNTDHYIYGRLDLQPDVKSIVVWELNRDMDNISSDVRNLWLFNIKDNKLCSIALLDFRPEIWIDTPPLDSKTYIKNKRFTARDERINDNSFWVNLELWLYEKEHRIDVYFSHYRVNTDGFIEFVSK